jgi:hypothetical protein
MEIYASQNQLYILFEYRRGIIGRQPHLIILGELAVGFYNDFFGKIIAIVIRISPAVVIESEITCTISA